MGDTERIFAANGHEVVQAELLPVRLELLDVVHLFERIRAGGAKNRAAPRENSRDGKIRERFGISMD